MRPIVTDDHLNLRLIAWYACAGHGFAMPLFGQSEGANTLYTARCSIPGDHRATIAEFEPVDVFVQHRLPADESIPLSVGDPWHDVFVWNGNGYVGTPDALWAELKPFHGDLRERAPLSLLDLAMQADQDEVHRLASVAFAHVEHRFDRARAKRWRRQLVRQWLEVKFRRALVGHDYDEVAYQSVVVVEERPNALTAISPSGLLKALIDVDAVRGVSGDLGALAKALGAEVSVSDASNVNVASDETLPPMDAPPPASPVQPVDSPIEVVVIAEGRRARDIVGHIRRSQKTTRAVAQLGKISDWLIASSARDHRGLLDRPDLSASTIILLFDEEDPESETLLSRLARYLHEQANAGALVILVPALPVRHPSRLFDGSTHVTDLGSECHAILDTAITRSPFWWGSPKRSFDRRIADVIGLAVAACRSRGLRKELRDQRTGKSPPVMSVGLVPRVYDSRQKQGGTHAIWLGSEVSWVTGDPKRGDSAILFSLRINPDEIDLQSVEAQVMVEGRRHEQRFTEFAGTVLAHLLGRRYRAPGRSSWRVSEELSVPDAIAERLVFPKHSHAFQVKGDFPEVINLVVVGETPTVDAVAAAERIGWRVARYTDSATIRRIAGETGQYEVLPDEIDIGTVRSSELNRHLATRGVDQRDVFRISQDMLQEWLDTLPFAERRVAHEAVRPMRSGARPYGEPDNDHLLTRDYVLGNDPAARQLVKLLKRKGKVSMAVRPLKRGADLRHCWTTPSAGFRRYAIVDGTIPVIVVELRNEEVPVEDLFAIDGDEAVPALFRSRVFRIWARATLPSASSWMARFSVINTFGGFPIVEPFRIVGQEGSLAALVTDGAPHRLGALSREVGKQIERQLASLHSRGWKAAHNLGTAVPAMDQLNAMILEFYGLSQDAKDIAVLRRLHELNAMLP